MKYIVTEEEMAKIKDDSQKVGFINCEKLMIQVLSGVRSLSEITSEGSRPLSHDSVWTKLIERLDAASATTAGTPIPQLAAVPNETSTQVTE